MRLPPFTYLQPRTVKQALNMLDSHGNRLKVMAGGIDTIPLMNFGLLSPSYVMSLRLLPGLKGIRNTGKQIVVGPATTLQEIAISPYVGQVCGGILEAAQSVAAWPIRNRATIAGNLLQNTRCLFYDQSGMFQQGLEPCFKRGGDVCHAVPRGTRCFSVYQGDMAPALISFQAKVKLDRAGSSRTVYVSDLFTGNGRKPLAIGDDELLTRILIPIPAGPYGSAYEKIRLRGSLDYPVASSAALLSVNKNGVIEYAHIVIGTAGAAPRTLHKAALILEGKRLDRKDIEAVAELAFKEAEGVDNLSLPGSYRRKMIKVATRRALSRALNNAKPQEY
jgi:4-hydroxybenzoyl-CoA reductase subunit beta